MVFNEIHDLIDAFFRIASEVNQIGDAVDDGGSATVFGRGALFSGELVLAILELQPEPRGVGGLFAARHDSARLFVSSGSGAAVFDCEPSG